MSAEWVAEFSLLLAVTAFTVAANALFSTVLVQVRTR